MGESGKKKNLKIKDRCDRQNKLRVPKKVATGNTKPYQRTNVLCIVTGWKVLGGREKCRPPAGGTVDGSAVS